MFQELSRNIAEGSEVDGTKKSVEGSIVEGKVAGVLVIQFGNR